MDNNELYSEIKLLFEDFDADNDGFLSPEELRNLLISFGYEFSDESFSFLLDSFFKQDQQSNNIKITLGELILLIQTKTKETEIFEEYIEAFKIFDKHKNGRIKMEDLTELLVKFGEDIDDEDLKEFLMDCDLQNDGYFYYEDFVRFLYIK